MVVEDGILGIFAREGVSRAHLSTGSDNPFNMEVLQEEGPTCLSAREFMGIFDVEEIFVISDDGDSKRSSLEVVFPLGESKNDCKQFSVINIIVSFDEGEHFGEVGTGIKVTIDILLHKNGSCCKERGIGHE